MASAQELHAPEFPLVVQLLHEEILAAVHDGFHHHVDLAALALALDDLAALIDGRRRRHCARDVLAGFQRRDRLRRVIGNRGIDVDRVHVRIGEQRRIVGVARFDAESIAAGVELLLVAPANRVHFGIRVALVNRDEFRAESQADNGHPDLSVTAHPASFNEAGAL
jgi:hypothetical protein